MIYLKICFTGRDRGVPRFIRLISSGSIIEPNSYVREIMNNQPRWSTGGLAPQLKEAIDNGLEKTTERCD